MILLPEIGTAKDNQKSPIHDWYKFTAGFSHKLVDIITDSEGLNNESKIFDPFAGCGTTLVSAQKLGIAAVGNEAQLFMHEIISAKLNWSCQEENIHYYLLKLKDEYPQLKNEVINTNSFHPLLISLYEHSQLIEIYSIKLFIQKYIQEESYNKFFKLALSQVLHKCSIYVISAPYIVRGQKLKENKIEAISLFKNIINKMSKDIKELASNEQLSRVYLHDSRIPNFKIENRSCDICITSPPYLNNLDYGEVSKVHTCFWDITSNWNEVTEMVRKKLVTGSTTHYTKASFDFEKWKTEIEIDKKGVAFNIILDLYQQVSDKVKEEKGRKTFDILMCLYFLDMSKVLIEIRRVLKHEGRAYLVVGDSAPYGVAIPTTRILGEIAKEVGFHNYSITKIRTRGGKWSSLKHRHNKEVDENIIKIW